MLRKIRIAVSLFIFVLLSFFFLDFADFLPWQFHILAQIQFVPALLALNIGILAVIFILTILFGRIYCSTICPMGVYQDIISWFSKKILQKKRYTYSPAKNILRWSITVLAVAAFLFGFNFLVGLLDPYSAFGRMIVHVFKPAYLAGNNLLEIIFTHLGNHTFYKVAVYILSVSSLIIALITTVGIGVLAWLNGRTYCNTICPVGTVLGLVSRYSVFKIHINESKCNSCGICGRKCKASCIDSKNQKIDYSRCVDCFDCLEVCSKKALEFSYSPKKKNSVQPEKHIDESKRRFMMALVATTVASTKILAEKNILSTKKRTATRKTPITPPGSISAEHLQKKCSSCHLCVSKCPSHIIKPSFTEYGLEGMMQPVISFEKGFCNYDCTLCTEICPSGALSPLTPDMKHNNQMGKVQFIIENCIVYKYESNCGACSEHCPTQAVSMIPYKDDLTIPHTDTSICVGCGGCEYVCPSKPNKAIYVEGVPVHNKLDIQKEKVDKTIKVDDFGF